MKTRFITLEGGEGVGKTTNLTFIEAYLRKNGVSLVRTREPGGTALGEKLRALLLHEPGMVEEAELLLVFASRAQHLREVILPALEQGHWVLCDRFTDASYAYQGGGRGVPEERIRVLEEWIQGALKPDMTLLLDTSVAVGMERARSRGTQDRFEQEAENFFDRVRDHYLERFKQDPQRIRKIDASMPLEAVQEAIQRELDQLLEASR